MDFRPFTFLDAIRGIWRRKLRVTMFLLAIIIIVGAVTVFSPKTYISDAKLFVKLGRENMMPDVPASLRQQPGFATPLSRESEIVSITEMIQNKELYGKVVDRVGADQILDKVSQGGGEGEPGDPSLLDKGIAFLQGIGVLNDLDSRERAIIKLQKKVTVSGTGKSNVVTINFESYSPALAQRVVSELLAGYTEQHRQVHHSRGKNEFLAEQTELAQREMHEDEQLFEDFKTRTKIMSITGTRDASVARVARIQNELLETDALIASAQAEEATLTRLVKEIPKIDVVARTSGAGTEGLEGMREELFRLYIERERIQKEKGTEHPSFTEIDERYKNAKQFFDSQLSTVVHSVEGPSKLYEDSKIELNRKLPGLNALIAKKAKLEHQLEQINEETASFNSNETEFLRLQRQLELSSENYKSYVLNLQQSRLDSSLEANDFSNLSVYQRASFNPKPHRPNKLLNLLGGLLLGVLGGCGMAVIAEYLDTSLRSAEEIERTLDLPVVTTLPRLPQRLLLPTR